MVLIFNGLLDIAKLLEFAFTFFPAVLPDVVSNSISLYLLTLTSVSQIFPVVWGFS
jgi:hypothetical protein